MKPLTIILALVSVSALPLAAQTPADTADYSATAHFTSGLVDGKPVDRIETASLDQEIIGLYVNWDQLALRAYRTEVRIIDPNGRIVGKIRHTILPGSRRYHSYYYYRPKPGDTPGDWTYRMLVDGRNAFEARIPVLPGN